MASGQSGIVAKSKKQVGGTLSSLMTTDAFETVSDSGSEAEVLSDIPPGVDTNSEDPQPTETDVEAALRDIEGEDTELQRVLAEMGFVEDASGEPLLPAAAGDGSDRITTAGEPPRYKNLFWRAYLASRRPSGLTAARLQQQQPSSSATAFPFGEHFSPTRVGEWLAGFKSFARSVPVRDVTACLLGEELGSEVADFVGEDAMGDSDPGRSTPSPGEAPDGQRVVASRYLRIPAFALAGRDGFVFDSDVSISTPGQCSPRRSVADSDAATEEIVPEGGSTDLLFPLRHSSTGQLKQSGAFDGTL